jgi:hypothetical protein
MRIPLCSRLAALSWCLFLAPATRAANTQAIEDACRQAATEDRITLKDMDDYMKDCMSESMQDLDDEAVPLSEDDARLPNGGDEELAPEGDQEPAPVD